MVVIITQMILYDVLQAQLMKIVRLSVLHLPINTKKGPRILLNMIPVPVKK
jgi:hypothetical protein